MPISQNARRVSEDKKSGQGPIHSTVQTGVKEAYANPIHDRDGVPGMTPEHTGWDVYNNEARKVDTELVKDWNASLNALLLFAAIFAAVLTAFIIESKKRLEQDPASVMVDVMILFANNVANGTHTPYTKTEFRPSSSDIIVNCLFFASLSSSLAAALASVIALQWVADYDATTTRGGSSPEDRAKRRQFRYAGVIRWKLSEIIAALPILLYCSVALFLSGVIIWMLDVKKAVGIVVAIGTGVVVVFYCTSTLLSVAFVSAPFRTPVTGWVYSLSQFPFFLLYKLILRMAPTRVCDVVRSGGLKRSPTMTDNGTPTSSTEILISWLKRRYLAYSVSHKREDQTVENKHQLRKDALIWLANQLSISEYSYQRLLLLASELRYLEWNELPSFGLTEASWWSIFDLIGRRYFTSLDEEHITADDRREMEILHRCYALPGVQEILVPIGLIEDEEDHAIELHEDYWSQHCGAEISTNSRRPNHLFLLLRDIPTSSIYSDCETETLIRLAYWRNQVTKPPEVWNRVVEVEQSLSTEFMSECITLFGQFSRSISWSEVVVAADGTQKRDMYLAIAGSMADIVAMRRDISPPTIRHLVEGYKSLATMRSCSGPDDAAADLARLFYYGEELRRGPATRGTAHNQITLLLARNLGSYPSAERRLRVKEVIAMLWLRFSNPALIAWKGVQDGFWWNDGVDPFMHMDWIEQVDQVPDILEILRHLSQVQTKHSSVGPLWRTLPEDDNDPHFIEVLQSFDRLIGRGCTEADHCMLIGLVCQDLEMEHPPNFDDYFNAGRVDSIAQLKDPCLQIIANCARGVDCIKSIITCEPYRGQRRPSYDRIMLHLLKRCPGTTSPHVLDLQASLLPIFSGSHKLYQEAIEKLDTFIHIRHVFRGPICCTRCVDGPYHSTWHILWQNLHLIDSIPMDFELTYTNAKSRYLRMLHAGVSLDLKSLFPHANESTLRLLKEEIDTIVASRSLLLALVLNAAHTANASKHTGNPRLLAAILVGAHKALKLPHDFDATSLLEPLSKAVLLLRGKLPGHGEVEGWTRRSVIYDEATEISQLLLTELATRIVSGRCNNRTLSCARAVGAESSPAVGCLPLYDG